jgi:transposase
MTPYPPIPEPLCVSENTAATCRMLLEGEEHLWTVFLVRGIEPTNNAAERALRHAVLWRKSSGGTASEWGSRLVERVLSVAATCLQQGRNVLEYLTGCFRAHVTSGPLPLTAGIQSWDRSALIRPL